MIKPRIWGIVGPVGVGKTTITTTLCKTYNAKSIFEEFEDNPFIEDFYRSENLLENQLWFIKNDFARLSKALNSKQDLVIVDKLFIQNFTYIQITSDFTDIEKQKCLKLYNENVNMLKQVDLIINLSADSVAIKDRINKRNRDLGEDVLTEEWLNKFQQIQFDYITKLSNTYKFKLINYKNDSFDLSTLIDIINNITKNKNFK